VQLDQLLLVCVQMATHAELIEQGIHRRESILDYIRKYHQTNGFPPSMEEIAESQRIAKSAVRHHLYRLQRDGHLQMTPGKYRSIRVLD
jgi:SOS-response transcriptional repressor LexA